MKICLLFYMCHIAMGLTHCYKTTVFFTFITILTTRCVARTALPQDVCHTHTPVLSKSIIKLLHRQTATPFQFFRTKPYSMGCNSLHGKRISARSNTALAWLTTQRCQRVTIRHGKDYTRYCLFIFLLTIKESNGLSFVCSRFCDLHVNRPTSLEVNSLCEAYERMS